MRKRERRRKTEKKERERKRDVIREKEGWEIMRGRKEKERQ